MSLITVLISSPLYANLETQCKKGEDNQNYVEVVCPPLKALDQAWDKSFKPPKPYLDTSLAYQSGTTGTSGTTQSTSGSSSTTSGPSSDSTFQDLETQTWQ